MSSCQYFAYAVITATAAVLLAATPLIPFPFQSRLELKHNMQQAEFSGTYRPAEMSVHRLKTTVRALKKSRSLFATRHLVK